MSDYKQYIAIKKELNKLRKELIAKGEKENVALNLARQEMNRIYGYAWRNLADTGN